jgi:hypothetical protein
MESRKRNKLSRGPDHARNPFLDDDDDDDDDEEEEEDDEQPKRQLTAEDIRTKLAAIRSSMEELKQYGAKLKEQYQVSEEKISDLKLQKQQLDHKPRAICIAARNEWSRSQIQDDYAQGIRELDEECAEEDDGENFNPDAELRDYEEVARSLPVFCVSSRAYQVLEGRLKAETLTKGGYPTLADTEMPQLLEHCIKMTEVNRFATARNFLEDFTKLLFSLSVWSSNDGSGMKLSSEELEQERSYLSRCLDTLVTAMEKAGDSMMDSIEKAQDQHIGQLCDRAVKSAVAKVPTTVDRWNKPQAEGTIHWMTYRAILRRGGGPYTDSRKRSYDFNDDLSDPFQTKLTSGWSNCFEKALPKIFATFSRSLNLTLGTFHQAVSNRAQARGIGLKGVKYMARKKELWKDSFNTKSMALKKESSVVQKDVNRELACPEITRYMEKTYTGCLSETGQCYHLTNAQPLTLISQVKDPSCE